MADRRSCGPWSGAGGAAAVLAVVALLLGVAGAGPARAQTASVSISPLSSTVKSGTAVTYTMSVTCSVSGGCSGTTVTFPTTTISGDGNVTDFGAWFGDSSCPGVTKAVVAGTVTYTYGNIATGTSQCTFTVTPPNLTTANGTVATLTPTIGGSNFSPGTGPAASLTVTASASGTSFSKQASVGSIGPGGAFNYKIFITCPAPGGLATSAVTITDPLPSNFTYTSATTSVGTVSYDPATRTVTMTANGNVCQGPNNDMQLNIYGTASTGGVPDTPPSTIANTASASVTFSDGSSMTPTSTLNVPVVNLVPVPFLAKSGAMADWNGVNKGQYKFNGTAYAYTFPGNWNGSGAPVSYPVNLKVSQANAGVDFAVQDPLPCLSNLSGGVYTSNPPGTTCASPAFIPTLVTASGFTPTAADVITVIRSDGTTTTTAYSSSAGGWPVPASPAGAEIDIPPFTEEGRNTATTITFTVKGYAAPSVATPSLLTDTATANAYLTGTSTPLVPPETASGSVMVASPAEPSGTVFEPYLAQSANGTACTAVVNSSASNQVEIAAAPSAAIYIAYLAPAGATVSSGTAATFKATALAGGTGGPYTTAAIAATVTTNYNGTGRTLLEWVIPAGTITAPGYYNITGMSVGLSLGAGCAGVYTSDVTIGYGATVTSCITNSTPQASPPPWNPLGDSDLHDNGTPLTGNYCGYSLSFTINPVNPAFSVTKTVQGNLDAAPVATGGTGDVSPTGGTATYNVTFANTGATNLVNPVLYDILPAVGDTLATSATSRGSQFGVTLTGVGPVPPGVTVYYSTAANPCRPQVLPANPGCVSDWSTTPPSPLSAVTALEFAYAGTVYVNGGNGPASISVPFTVATPPVALGLTAKNTVGATAMPGAGEPLMSPAESSVTVLAAAVIGLVKSVASPAGAVTAAGQVITYRFLVTNTTGVTLTGIAVTDAQAPPAGGLTSGPDCPDSSLAPGQSQTCTAAYTVTQADLDHGSVADSATARGTPPAGGPVPSRPSAATVPATRAPAISIVKSASAPDAAYFLAGQRVTYTFVVTNTGNVTLAPIVVTDTGFTGTGSPPAVSCPAGGTAAVASLAPGTQAVCTATYTLTPADVDAGHVSDTGVATGTPPFGPDVTATSHLDLPAAQHPALSVVKSASPAAVHAAGDVITYRLTVTNAGNTTLNGITVDDSQLPPASQAGRSPVSCPDTTLAAGQVTTCTATYTVTQADIDHGGVDDTATASGTPPSGLAVSSPPARLSVPAVQAPALTMVKSAPAAEVQGAGDVIGYRFALTNTGNVTLTGIAVSDVQAPPAGDLDGPVACPDTTLAPGVSTTCTATYTVTPADVSSGSVDDAATASGTPPTGPAVTSAPSAVSVLVPAGPAINVVKSATPAQLHAAGDVVTYRFTVINTGGAALSGITVSDVQAPPAGDLDGPVACPDTTLAPGASTTCSATYTVTQADIENGSVTDTATASGSPPSGPAVTSPTVNLRVTTVRSPALSVVKSTMTTSVTRAGQQVPYSFVVTNAGNVTLAGVTVTDNVMAPSDPAGLSPVSCPQPILAPGESEICTAAYAVTQADVDHGRLADSATVTGIPPAMPGNPNPSPLPPSPPSAVTIPAPSNPGISVVKTSDKDPLTVAGEQVQYFFLVANTGNVTLTDVGVSDVVAPPSSQANLTPVTCPRTVLAPLASMTCTATYTVTAADLAKGSLGNTATAYGTPPYGPVVRSRPHTISVTVTGGPVSGEIVIPTGEGASAVPGASPALVADGAAALAAGAAIPLLLFSGRRRGSVTPVRAGCRRAGT